jgi:CBS domain-containing protein
MTPKSLTLRADDSVDDAMSFLLRHSISGAPVVDANNVLIGFVSSFDFLQKEAFGGALLPMEGSRDQIEKYVQAAQKICGQNVRDIMSPVVTTLTPEIPMREAAEIMSNARLHRLPVVDSDNKVVGILSSADVMRDLLHIVRNLPPGKNEEILDP